MKPFKVLTLSIGLIALSACETMDNMMADLGDFTAPTFSRTQPVADDFVTDSECPRVELVEELSTFNEFADISDPSDYNLISSVQVANLESACTHNAKSVTVDLKLAFDGRLGPRGIASDSTFFSYPFFVAVTAPGGDILAKEVFSANMTYKKGQERQTYYENMRQLIPVTSTSKAPKYRVLVGFQLNQNQLAFNRQLAAARQAAGMAEPAAGNTVQLKAPEPKPAPIKVEDQRSSEPIDITAPAP